VNIGPGAKSFPITLSVTSEPFLKTQFLKILFTPGDTGIIYSVAKMKTGFCEGGNP
jgi:hypothetical protein